MNKKDSNPIHSDPYLEMDSEELAFEKPPRATKFTTKDSKRSLHDLFDDSSDLSEELSAKPLNAGKMYKRYNTLKANDKSYNAANDSKLKKVNVTRKNVKTARMKNGQTQNEDLLDSALNKANNDSTHRIMKNQQPMNNMDIDKNEASSDDCMEGQSSLDQDHELEGKNKIENSHAHKSNIEQNELDSIRKMKTVKRFNKQTMKTKQKYPQGRRLPNKPKNNKD